ncbi:S8 family serine peptidase [uncultured Nitratireductor sp.]|uniref:S8 family peptidase n=1 Tax=uncultured Nitratireductor sp. TaxID=520953 RepID=UPI0025E8224D|nr:S8 family serine peptidase [uncultured Nitratireductor sp.]
MYYIYIIFLSHALILFFPDVAFADDASLASAQLDGGSDPETDAQWGLGAIDAAKAYALGFSGQGVRVGVYDSGIDTGHREFAGRLTAGSFDLDASLLVGRMTPVGGDSLGHGSFVSGIIAANRDFSGMHGVAYDASVVMVSGDIWRYTFDTYTSYAYQYFKAFGIDLVNASLGMDDDAVPGGIVDEDFLQRYFPQALAAIRNTAHTGTVTVWAVGNDATSIPQAPARLPLYYPELEDVTLAVAALNRRGKRARYSARCGVAATWCLAAPGGEGRVGSAHGIRSVKSGGGYMTARGTSSAAPHVTGTLAVSRQIFPRADMRDLRRLVLHTAVDLGDAGIDAVYGWGGLSLGNVVDTIAPHGRSIFAGAAFNRQLSMQQVSRLPFADVSRAGSHKHLWVAGDLASMRIAMSPGSPATNARSRAFAAGVDLEEQDGLRAGIGLAHTMGRTDEDGTANSASAHGFHGFGYGDWQDGAWYAKGAAGVASFLQKHTRRTLPGLDGTVLARSKPEARSSSIAWGAFAHAETGRIYDLGPADMRVFARFTGTAQSYGRVTERGLPLLGYTLHAGRRVSARMGLGMRLSRPFAAGPVVVSPEFELSHARMLGRDDHAVDTDLLGRKMRASTTTLGRDIFGIGGALRFEDPQRGLAASVGYAGSFRKNANRHDVTFGLSLKF